MSCCLKYPGFCSGVKEGRREWEIDSQMDWCCFCRDADAVAFCPDEKKLSVKANLLIFRSVYIPSFTCGQQLWTKERDCRYKQQKCVSSKGRLGSALQRSEERVQRRAVIPPYQRKLVEVFRASN